MTREEKILTKIQVADQIGLEIGPLHKPIVTREMGAVRYVDHATTEELKIKCAQWGTVDISKIVDVDYVWGAKDLKEITFKECPFDYVIASHVIEHVPDFIGWVKEIHSVLKPGGILSLAVPDKRFTYDYYRNLTKPADVFEAYLNKSKKPSVKQVFDYHAEFVRRMGYFSWSVYGFERELKHEHTIEGSMEIAKNAFEKNIYVDVHCWVVTERSFYELLKSLISLDLFDFKIAKNFHRAGHEFFVSLEALDLTLKNDVRKAIQLENINMVLKEVNNPFQKLIFDFKTWKIIHLLRLLKNRYFL